MFMVESDRSYFGGVPNHCPGIIRSPMAMAAVTKERTQAVSQASRFDRHDENIQTGCLSLLDIVCPQPWKRDTEMVGTNPQWILTLKLV